MSCTPDLLLNVRDAKKNETDSSLDHEAPKKDGFIFHNFTSARHYHSVPDLRDSSLLSCSGLELSKPISRIKEAKSAPAVNIFPLPLTSLETFPEPTTQVSDSSESLQNMTVATSSECSSPEMDSVVSLKCKQQQIPRHFVQEKISKISLPTKSQRFFGSQNPHWILLKNNAKKRHLLSELFTKVQLREKLFLLPAPYHPRLVLRNQSQNSFLPQKCYFRSQSSGEKRSLDMSSLLLLQSSHSHDVSLRDLLVVATPARLDPRPGRSHTGPVRDPCIQRQEVYSHCLISGQKRCERK